MISQRAIIQGTRADALPLTPLDMDCPLVSAMSHWKGRQCLLSTLNDKNIYNSLVHFLPTFGRPLPQKINLLGEHHARVVQLYGESDNRNEAGACVLRTSSNSIRKAVSLHTTNIDWTKLTQIHIRDLVLYDSYEDNFIEGKLLVEPFTPRVGTTTIMEDSNGDVVLIALYNFLPDGLYGRDSIPLASTKLPPVASVRIAGPFLKIFQDGSRGLELTTLTTYQLFHQANAILVLPPRPWMKIDCSSVLRTRAMHSFRRKCTMQPVRHTLPVFVKLV